MIISCKNRKLDFTVEAPPSKSIYHRELIVRFLMGDKDSIGPKDGDNDDVKATKACLNALKNGGDVITLPCNESGSTLRFMIPVASAYALMSGKKIANKLIFETKGRLFDRPLKELDDAMSPHGIVISKNPDTREIIVTGDMTPGEYVIDGSVSSQYISGLIMALPLFDLESSVKVVGEMKSVHYIELTQNVMSKYGCDSPLDGDTFRPATNGYKANELGDFKVEGDWSNGAFLLCLSKAVCNNVKVTNLDPKSAQGDKAILDFLATVESDGGSSEVVFECNDIPDIVPYMAVTAAFEFKKAVFKGIGRLRIKESDRVMAVREQLGAIGVKTEETEDTLTVYGYSKEDDNMERPVKISSYHDHRMAMCAVLIAARLLTEVEVDDIECVNKSYPELQDLIRREMMP